MNLEQKPQIVQLAYDFNLAILPQIATMPRNQRYQIGERLESRVLDFLESLVEATYTRDKKTILQKASLDLEKIRFLLRLCFDLKLWDLKKYERFSVYTIELGKQLGGWLKSG